MVPRSQNGIASGSDDGSDDDCIFIASGSDDDCMFGLP